MISVVQQKDKFDNRDLLNLAKSLLNKMERDVRSLANSLDEMSDPQDLFKMEEHQFYYQTVRFYIQYNLRLLNFKAKKENLLINGELPNNVTAVFMDVGDLFDCPFG